MSLFNKLFIEGVRYEKEKVIDDNIYPFNIPAIKNLDELKFEKPVTFLIGENGAGKIQGNVFIQKNSSNSIDYYSISNYSVNEFFFS